MIVLDALGQRYGLRPSAMVRVRNPFAALTLDLAARNAGVEAENAEAGKLAARSNSKRRQ